MGQLIVTGAMMKCSFGVAPMPINVLPVSRVNAVKRPAATIMDNIPMTNIPSFGMCQSPSNPAVIAATSAASGVFTPAPCVPVTPAPWVPGSPTVLIGKKPALNNNSKLMCSWAGVITFTMPGQVTVNVK